MLDTFNVFWIVLVGVRFFGVNSFPLMCEVRRKCIAEIHHVFISFGESDQLFEREDSLLWT